MATTVIRISDKMRRFMVIVWACILAVPAVVIVIGMVVGSGECAAMGTLLMVIWGLPSCFSLWYGLRSRIVFADDYIKISGIHRIPYADIAAICHRRALGIEMMCLKMKHAQKVPLTHRLWKAFGVKSTLDVPVNISWLEKEPQEVLSLMLERLGISK